MMTLLRRASAVLLLAVLLPLVGCTPGSGADLPDVTVYKSPTCGCCSKWVDHLKENGFDVKTIDRANVTPVKERLGVPAGLRSCHTAVVDGYAVEGHVPADVLKRFLKEQPEAAGLTVPGMPIGSPGMEGPNPEAYQVVEFGGGRPPRVYMQMSAN